MVINMYLHSASQAEDAVVGFLGLETLEGSLDDIVFLGNQIIGPVRQLALAHVHNMLGPLILSFPSSPPKIFLEIDAIGCEGCVPQAELPVTGSVAVPVGEGLHPALEPWALVDKGGERRRRHGCGESTVGCGCRRGGLPSIADYRSGEVVVLFCQAKDLNWDWPSLDLPEGLSQHATLCAPHSLTEIPSCFHRCDVCHTQAFAPPQSVTSRHSHRLCLPLSTDGCIPTICDPDHDNSCAAFCMSMEPQKR